jgi:hypothetical protein
MISLKTFCRRLQEEPGPLGDFARDTWDSQFGPRAMYYQQRDGINPLRSSTFYGLAAMLPWHTCGAAEEALVLFWQAWIDTNYPVLAPQLRRGWVYLIENKVTHLYKIGRTQNLPQRQAGLRSATQQPVHLLEAVHVTQYMIIEKELHRVFASRHQGGEWFLCDDRTSIWALRHALYCYQETDPLSTVYSEDDEEAC